MYNYYNFLPLFLSVQEFHSKERVCQPLRWYFKLQNRALTWQETDDWTLSQFTEKKHSRRSRSKWVQEMYPTMCLRRQQTLYPDCVTTPANSSGWWHQCWKGCNSTPSFFSNVGETYVPWSSSAPSPVSTDSIRTSIFGFVSNCPAQSHWLLLDGFPELSVV